MARHPETPQEIANKAIISKHLNALLLARGTTQAKVSDVTHIPRSTLTGYFKGTTTPSAVNASKLAAFFGVSRDQIDPRYGKPAGAAVVDLAEDTSPILYQGKPLSHRELLLIRHTLDIARHSQPH